MQLSPVASALVNMVHKRPFDEEESNEVSPKQLRQLEHNSNVVTPLKFPCGAGESLRASDDGYKKSTNIEPEGDENFSNSAELPFLHQKDVADMIHGSVPTSSLATRSAIEENFRLEPPFHVLLSPDCYYSERTPRTNIHSGEIYSFLLDYPPRKLVPIGPGFQADISSLPDESVQIHLSDYEKRLAGSVVIPMPEFHALSDSEVIRVERTDCSCQDVGSIKCVGHHIIEAREKLKKTFGIETFAELGFCDMGETVAEKWGEEEEQMFHKVVFSNPMSSGMNFWENLSVAFPSRTKKEIVSYYFNVFMLRRRAEQNGFASMEIDSDNDEWPGSVNADDDNDEVEIDDNDNVQPPANPEGRVPFCDGNDGPIQKCTGNVYPKCSIDAMTQPASVGVLCHETKHGDIEANAGNTPNVRSDTYKQWTSHFSGHEFMLDGSGYLNRTKDEIDLLPTCNMIEEVFGAGSSNYKTRDGRGI